MRAIALGLFCTIVPAAPGAELALSATLAGRAVLPAGTVSAPPADAPADARTSGKYTEKSDTPAAPLTLERNGVRYPFLGQPVQGISGFAMDDAPGGGLYGLIDNGYGRKSNSSDALLSLVQLVPDYEAGTVDVAERIWLHDPDHLIPFEITHETTEQRYLTGADFDPEALQRVDDVFWIGDEFGPYLISASAEGRVTGVFDVALDGEPLLGPDHSGLLPGSKRGSGWRVARSGGLEGLGLDPGTGLLWAIFERPLLGAEGAPEGRFIRALAFDPKARVWTGQTFKLALTEGAQAIGDLNFVDASRALVIERDNGQGDPARACGEDRREDCFERPARVKRVTLIDTSRIDEQGFAARLAQIDLLAIADERGLASSAGTNEGNSRTVFTFPFLTIESVRRDGSMHIVLANDNNLPFSAGREIGVADKTEIIRLFVPKLLNTR